MENIIVFIALIALGYVAGTMAEKSHYKSIKQREHDFLNLPAVTIKNAIDEKATVKDTKLVTGSVVISVDYFKRFLAGLRNVFGGEVMSYESLLDRARREAILRMKESAKGATIIVNLRLETSTIGSNANQKKTIGSIEAVAYGTAITL